MTTFSKAIAVGSVLVITPILPLWAGPEPSVSSGKPPALREMSTDRPDATESPFTVDVGHVQIESDIVFRGKDKSQDNRSSETQIGALNLRFGVTARTELGLFVSPYVQVVDRLATGEISRRTGFGDLVVRGKFNFWGNDGGRSAFGVIVDLSLPTAENRLGTGRVVPSLLIPFDCEVGGGWSFGAMAGGDLRRSNGDSRYRGVLISTAVMGHAVTTASEIYFELTSEAGDGSHVATFNTGLTFRLNPDLQFDTGVNLGISDAATDNQLFVGVARRF